jgi:O-antigen/teichoic acid export membrane protein
MFKKLFSNTVFLTAAHCLNRIFNALIVVIVARYLGLETFGMYSTALALVNTFLIANDIGSTTLLLREGARDEKKIGLYLGNSNLIQFFASIGFFALALITAYFLKYNALTVWLVILLGIGTVIFEFRKSFRGVLRIFLKLKFFAYLEIINGLLTFTSIYAVSKLVADKNLGLTLIAGIPLILNFLLIAALFIYDRKFVKPEYDLKKIWPMIKEGYEYSIYNIVYTVYFQISTLMVQGMKGDSEAGLYSAAAKLIMLLLIIPQMIFQVALPLMFKYSKIDLAKYKRIHKFIFRYLNAFAFPIIVGCFLLADPIIRFVYHKENFMPAAPALAIMSIFLVARFIGNVSGQSLTAMDKQKPKLIMELVSLVVLVGLNFWLINLYGFIGAAIATATTEIILRISFLFFDFSALKENFLKYLKSLVAPLLASLVMGIFLYFTKSSLNVIVLILLGAVLYGLFLWAFRFVSFSDKQLFKQLIPSRFQKNESSNTSGGQL